MLDSDGSPHWDYREAGVATIYDSAGLAGEFGLLEADLHDPNGYDSEDGRVVGWSVVKKLVQVVLERQDRLKARELVSWANGMRRAQAQRVQDLRAEYYWLDASHPALTLIVQEADRVEQGLESLVPGILEVRRHESARLLLREADELFITLSKRLNEARPGLRQQMLDDIEAFRRRLASFEDASANGGARLVRSAESPQETPSSPTSDGAASYQDPWKRRDLNEPQHYTDRRQPFRFNV